MPTVLSHARRLPLSFNVIRRLLALRALRRSRRALANLPPHLLRDVGITALQAETEADKPIWDAPAFWLR